MPAKKYYFQNITEDSENWYIRILSYIWYNNDNSVTNRGMAANSFLTSNPLSQIETISLFSHTSKYIKESTDTVRVYGGVCVCRSVFA